MSVLAPPEPVPRYTLYVTPAVALAAQVSLIDPFRPAARRLVAGAGAGGRVGVAVGRLITAVAVRVGVAVAVGSVGGRGVPPPSTARAALTRPNVQELPVP